MHAAGSAARCQPPAAAVAGAGVLHVIVLDHRVPITLIARRHGRSRSQTPRVAFKAGVGHALSVLVTVSP